jgi:hypothetical protein
VKKGTKYVVSKGNGESVLLFGWKSRLMELEVLEEEGWMQYVCSRGVVGES